MITSASLEPEDLPDVSMYTEPIDEAIFLLQRAKRFYDSNVPRYLEGNACLDRAVDQLLSIPYDVEL